MCWMLLFSSLPYSFWIYKLQWVKSWRNIKPHRHRGHSDDLVIHLLVKSFKGVFTIDESKISSYLNPLKTWIVLLFHYCNTSFLQNTRWREIRDCQYMKRCGFFGKVERRDAILDTSKFYDGSIFPTSIGTKPSFEYNFFDIHLLSALFPAFILLPFYQYNNQFA